MAKIKQLPLYERQKIAAGEVVERPANVVKELVENALDAGATAISVYIEDSGKKLIRIIDDGSGMDAEDAGLCFGHHATSKIQSIDDLQTLRTFGFRGEALSSIASISKVTLITREHAALQGTKITLEGGIVIEQTPCASSAGTDIQVHDLFFNVPARKKFLKTNETEWRHIVTIMQALALAHINVHFKLFSDGAQIFNSPAVSSCKDRVMQLWDNAMASHTIPLSASDEHHGITISGLITDHQYYRYDRSSFFFFVNQRWVKSLQLGKALCKGYLNVLPGERFPAAFLSIAIDPAQIDVNTHPRKEEVHFVHGKVVEYLVQKEVKETLQRHLSQQLGKSITFAPAIQEQRSEWMPVPAFSRDIPSSFPVRSFTTISEPFSVQEQKEETPTALFGENAQPFSESSLWPQNYQIIGQLHKTYWLLEHPQGMLIVDQHAAHERILYERFGQRFGDVSSVNLLFPQIISLSESDYGAISAHKDLFHSLGIEFEEFGQSQLRIVATPVHVKDISFAELIQYAVSLLHDNSNQLAADLARTLHHDLRAQMACKAAVKAGDELTHTQITQMLNDLGSVENRFTCPHGRPTCWLLRKDEIEKKFKRRV